MGNRIKITAPRPFDNTSIQYSQTPLQGGGFIARNHREDTNVAVIATDDLRNAIPEAGRLADLLRVDAQSIESLSQELRHDLIESRIKGRAAAQTAIISSIRTAHSAGLQYADRTASDRVTLQTPVNVDAATTTTLQSHFMGLKSVVDRMAFLSILRDFEVGAVAKLPPSVIGLEESEIDRLITARVIRHNISVEMQRVNPKTIYVSASISNLFPAKEVDALNLNVFVEMKEREWIARQKIMVQLSNLINSALTYMQIVYGFRPNDTFDKVLGQE